MQPADFKLDLDDERLWRGGKPVELSNKAFRLLRLFVDNPNRLLTKDDILEGVWCDVCVTEGLVKEYVHDLRLALCDSPRKPRYIETVRGRGYRFLGGIARIGQPEGRQRRARAPRHALSLAVTAFTNLSADPEQEYFADGITEDIIIGLSKHPHLSVISRDSTYAYKGKSMPAPRIGAELGAQFVLEGSVRKAGRHLRVAAELIDSADDLNLWAEIYDRDLGDIFAVQDEVVSSIVHALGATDGAIEKSAWERVGETPETDLTAYDCYLKAQEYFYRRHASGYNEAEALYEKAIELDLKFARAYSALAFLHFQRFKVYHKVSFESIEDKTRDLALHSLKLDSDEYVAHWVLGRLYFYLGKHAQGLAAFDRALSINPNDANVLNDSADYLIYYGRPQDAIERAERAIRLNPKCPDWYWRHLGFSNFHLGRYDDALRALERMTSPGQARRLLAAVYAQLGRLDEARIEAEKFMKFNPHFSIRAWARTEPYVDQNELQRHVEGLQKSGLPE